MNAILILMACVAAGGDKSTVEFDNAIIPVLTKAGCNTGACHGAEVGRGGFNLSLYGGDPKFDYRSIVLDLEGRRVNLARPDESLLVLKATESIVHGGGYCLEFEGAGSDLLLTWIPDIAGSCQPARCTLIPRTRPRSRQKLLRLSTFDTARPCAFGTVPFAGCLARIIHYQRGK